MALLPLARRFGWFLAVVLLAGLAGATLVRLAPGFGTDERMLDSRLSNGSIQAIAQERQVGAHVAAYYLAYLRGLLHGDLGTSISLGRPVRGLLAERAGTSFRSAGGGLGLAWACALALAGLLEWFRLRRWAAAASAAVGPLLAIPGALVAIGCFCLGGQPALAIAAILFPRLFRYTQSLVRQAAAAPHVLAAEALGQNPDVPPRDAAVA
jgi:peptide/nickel transport system permease protein